MDIILNDVEVRVLGCLLEKSMTTPDHYPLTLNALTNACNQKSNRFPVVSFEETTVVRGLDSLKEKRLLVQSDSSRVSKYAELFANSHNLVSREAATLMVLLLRGPQTPGELRTRTERAYKFTGLDEVGSVIEDLVDSGYIVKLPRQPGRKESRYAQLLAGEPEVETIDAKPEPARLEIQAENSKMASLAEEIESLRAEFVKLKDEFNRFKNEFE